MEINFSRSLDTTVLWLDQLFFRGKTLRHCLIALVQRYLGLTLPWFNSLEPRSDFFIDGLKGG